MKKTISIVFWLFFCVQLFAQDQNGFATFNPIVNQLPRNQGGGSIKYIQSCVAQYLTQDGWSKKYTVKVTFISGLRLNEATHDNDYSTFSTYGVIFWAEGEATIIKISTFLGCGTDVCQECIVNVIGDIKGRDQEERQWKICVQNFCY